MRTRWSATLAYIVTVIFEEFREWKRAILSKAWFLLLSPLNRRSNMATINNKQSEKYFLHFTLLCIFFNLHFKWMSYENNDFNFMQVYSVYAWKQTIQKDVFKSKKYILPYKNTYENNLSPQQVLVLQPKKKWTA